MAFGTQLARLVIRDFDVAIAYVDVRIARIVAVEAQDVPPVTKGDVRVFAL
jgi:hypothetical protein